MSEDPFEPAMPSFNRRKALSTATTSTQSLWTKKPHAFTPGTETVFTPNPSLQPVGTPTAKESQAGSLKHHSAASIFQPMYTTPPREASSNRYGMSDSSLSFKDPVPFRSEFVPGLLPDDEAIGEKFSVDIGESVEDVISGLKLQVETLVTAIMMSSGASVNDLAATSLQGADAIEIAHRIMERLKLLREENERLAQLANGTLAAKLEARNVELEREVKRLRVELDAVQRPASMVE